MILISYNLFFITTIITELKVYFLLLFSLVSKFFSKFDVLFELFVYFSSYLFTFLISILYLRMISQILNDPVIALLGTSRGECT